MNLAVDIGNSIVKVGLFNQESLVLKGRFATHPRKEADEWGILLVNWIKNCPEKLRVDKVIISSVAQSALIPLREAIKRYFKLIPLELNFKLAGIPILCDNPEEVGADRIANSVAATKLYRLPAIVIDFGTAITFDVISPRGEYLGGVIAPGIQLATDALWEKAEKLFPVEFKKPLRAIGKNTEDNLISGIFYSFLGGIKEILAKIEEEIGEKATVISTGGWGEMLRKECPRIDEVNPILTLQGLNFILIGLQVR
ncbi:type III pantothenate kinase [Patescibacteria group bacterium]|nr:type III pantothenate kinase [Patescibacteria group bacterium]